MNICNRRRSSNAKGVATLIISLLDVLDPWPPSQTDCPLILIFPPPTHPDYTARHLNVPCRPQRQRHSQTVQMIMNVHPRGVVSLLDHLDITRLLACTLLRLSLAFEDRFAVIVQLPPSQCTSNKTIHARI